MKSSLSAVIVVAAAVAAAVLVNAAPLPNQRTEVRSHGLHKHDALLYQRNQDQLVGRGVMDFGKSGIEVLDKSTHALAAGRELTEASKPDSKVGGLAALVYRPSNSHHGGSVHASSGDVDTELRLSNYPAAKRLCITATDIGAQHAHDWEGVDTELRLSSTAPVDQRVRKPDNTLTKLDSNDDPPGKRARAYDVTLKRTKHNNAESETYRLGQKHLRMREEINNVANTIHELKNSLDGQKAARLMRIRKLKKAMENLDDGAIEAHEQWIKNMKETRMTAKALIDAGSWEK